jgi:hypothetical protein
MLRVCVRCKVEKNLWEFHKDSREAGAHRYICKECRNKERLGNRPDNFVYRRRNERPDQNRAGDRVRLAVKKGILKRPDKCENCGKRTKPSGHHYNGYDHPLDVVWLCHQCHKDAHLISEVGLANQDHRP